MTSGIKLLLGVWLVLSPWVLNYSNAAPGFERYWNEVVVGVALAVLVLARLAAPRRFTPLSWVEVVLGAWLIASPWVLDYNDTYDIPRAVWNNVVVGALILLMGLASFLAALKNRQGREAG